MTARSGTGLRRGGSGTSKTAAKLSVTQNVRACHDICPHVEAVEGPRAAQQKASKASRHRVDTRLMMAYIAASSTCVHPATRREHLRISRHVQLLPTAEPTVLLKEHELFFTMAVMLADVGGVKVEPCFVALTYDNELILAVASSALGEAPEPYATLGSSVSNAVPSGGSLALPAAGK